MCSAWVMFPQYAMYVAEDGALAGIIAVADTVKEDSREAISILKGPGLEVVMMTGDNERTALAIAKEVGIDRVMADVVIVKAGTPVRFVFERREASPCSERVVFKDFYVSKLLPEGEKIDVEFTPPSPKRPASMSSPARWACSGAGSLWRGNEAVL